MLSKDEKKFKKYANVRRIEKCCATCDYFQRDWEYSGCWHPDQCKFDTTHECNFGAYGGTEVDEGFVCDLWKKKKKEKKDEQ